MKTDVFVAEFDETYKRDKNEVIPVEAKRCAERIWNAITKYVKFDQDAIFKDPNWPYY
jgi:hypothetical protein